jgi:DNA-binding MarR family transcriptional regulator
MNVKAFISYSSVDANLAKRVSRMLNSLGVEYFLDAKDVNWGDVLTEVVRNGIASCTDLVVIVSPASIKSQWVSFEIGHASALGKRILPLLAHPSVEVPSFIKQYHHKSRTNDVKCYFRQLLRRSSSGEVRHDRDTETYNTRDLLLAYAYSFNCSGRMWFSELDLTMNYYGALQTFIEEGTLTKNIDILMSHFPKKEKKELETSEALDESAVEAALDSLVADGLLERKRGTIFNSAFEITDKGRAHFSGQVRPRLFA